MTYDVVIGDRTASVTVHPHPDGGYRVAIDGGPERHVRSGRLGAAEWWLGSEGTRRSVAIHVDGEHVTAQVDGHGLQGTIVDPRERALAEIGGALEGVIRTPMPGAVARVLAVVGDVVKQGQVLVVVEAMKMENEYRSPIDGVVLEVVVAVGAAVDANALLLVVGPGAA